MADYSQFPFEQYTTDEIAQMMIQSVKVGDNDFIVACREQIKKRPTPIRQDVGEVKQCTCEPPEGYPHLPSCALYSHNNANAVEQKGACTTPVLLPNSPRLFAQLHLRRYAEEVRENEK